jgi:hypothetical protein
MARLRRNQETRRLFVEIPRGGPFTNHILTNAGETRIWRAGLRVDSKVPNYILQLLDQRHECDPLCHTYRGKLQLQFDDVGFLLVVTPPNSAESKVAKKKTDLSPSTPDNQLPLF